MLLTRRPAKRPPTSSHTKHKIRQFALSHVWEAWRCVRLPLLTQPLARAPVRLHKAGPVAQLGAGERVDDEDGRQLRQAVEARHLGALLRLVGHLAHGAPPAVNAGRLCVLCSAWSVTWRTGPRRRSTPATLACSAPPGRSPGARGPAGGQRRPPLRALLRLVGHLAHGARRRSTPAALACSAPQRRSPGAHQRPPVSGEALQSLVRSRVCHAAVHGLVIGPLVRGRMFGSDQSRSLASRYKLT